MSTEFDIRSADGSYGIEISRGNVEAALARCGAAAIICDRIFGERFARLGLPVVAIDAIEDNKTLEAAGDVVARLREAGVVRSDTLAVVGGGIVQDVGCFVASIYMRGAAWSYFPTTLLGMVDSCIGGKSSINVRGFKNIAGTFHPPRRIVVDTDFVATLTPDHVAGGYCEAAKICYVHGTDAFDRYHAMRPGADLPPAHLPDIVATSLRAKKWFVEVDEFDRKERLLLNFGHTFGHAVEAASDFAINHGLAVGVGVLCAFRFAERAQLGPISTTGRAFIHHISGLVRTGNAASPVLDRLDIDRFFTAFKSDKKHGRDSYVLIVPAASGEHAVARQAFPKTDATLQDVGAAFKEVCSELSLT